MNETEYLKRRACRGRKRLYIGSYRPSVEELEDSLAFAYKTNNHELVKKLHQKLNS